MQVGSHGMFPVCSFQGPIFWELLSGFSRRLIFDVIPASYTHSRAGGNPDSRAAAICESATIPRRHSGERRNLGRWAIAISRFATSPRRNGGGAVLRIGACGVAAYWIPAFAGMTVEARASTDLGRISSGTTPLDCPRRNTLSARYGISNLPVETVSPPSTFQISMGPNTSPFSSRSTMPEAPS